MTIAIVSVSTGVDERLAWWITVPKTCAGP
jgi:hypothetical protein